MKKYAVILSSLAFLLTACASAPADSYTAFVLYYYLDMTVADIARELNLSESAVKSRIHRLRASVRQKLAKEWQA